MKRVLIAGIGNILLGDDGVGPYVLRMLESHYVFDEGVELMDLGTPTLDFVEHMEGLDALIVVDAVEDDGQPGTIQLYRKDDLLQQAPSVRMDPHSPALVESLLAAEFYGLAPTDMLLVGMQGASYEAGCTLSDEVMANIDNAVAEVLRALDRMDVGFVRRFTEEEPRVWWMEEPAAMA
jgi:hydrogenase maturation protease